MTEKVNPQFELKAFNCPICGAFAKQWWSYAELYDLKHFGASPGRHLSTLNDYAFARCEHCTEVTIWKNKVMVYPIITTRDFNLTLVPKYMAEDYTEACLILSLSPKASAALSRRCLQMILREQGFTDNSLDKEIRKAIGSKTLPSHITDSIDSIRNIGNFAAHPQKDTSTGEIVPVEVGEAKWNLDVLEYLFDFYYIQPEKARQRKEAFNQKLKSAGKPEMK